MKFFWHKVKYAHLKCVFRWVLTTLCTWVILTIIYSIPITLKRFHVPPSINPSPSAPAPGKHGPIFFHSRLNLTVLEVHINKILHQALYLSRIFFLYLHRIYCDSFIWLLVSVCFFFCTAECYIVYIHSRLFIPPTAENIWDFSNQEYHT